MSVMVVGSVALDTLETPHGRAENILGGSASYFTLAASTFSPVKLVSVVGRDFPDKYRRLLGQQAEGLEGLTVADGETFRWDGEYRGAMNEAETRDVELNVFGDFKPEIPSEYRESEYVFLGNSSPHTQLHVCDQVPDASFVLADTMNLWIETEKEALVELLGEVDGLILNDDEARQFTEKHNLIDAADWIRDQGATYCIIKKAEHGAMFVGPEGIFALPGYPTDRVQDPTGAGDSFAGGFLGAAASMDAPMDTAFRHGLAYGTVVASFTIEDFGTAPIAGLSRDAVDSRLEQYLAMTQLPDRS